MRYFLLTLFFHYVKPSKEKLTENVFLKCEQLPSLFTLKQNITDNISGIHSESQFSVQFQELSKDDFENLSEDANNILDLTHE